MVRLIRTWIEIIAEQPAFVRALLLVLFLAMLSLYLLGIASLVAAARYTPLAAAAPTATSPAAAVERTVLSLATQIAVNHTPTIVPTLPPATATVLAVVVRESPIAAGTPTRTPTLEPTPTQVRAPARIAPPPEPSIAPIRPIAPAPIVIPSPLLTGTPRTGTPSPAASGTPRATLTPIGTIRSATGTPAGTRSPIAGTATVIRTPGVGGTAMTPTPTVRLGGPTPVGLPPVIAFPTPTVPAFVPLKPIAATPTVRR